MFIHTDRLWLTKYIRERLRHLYDPYIAERTEEHGAANSPGSNFQEIEVMVIRSL